ncbi:hypothetical protein AMS68_003888 [Peltaster fructicola]|uniref:AB hydrolase-1 domain-containing protein n=1 Tax=Peltaster fructicola TaxID=286661 RepID=A0A6H0XUM4_9PEZI|nr:hypothetical protein AMS68_003888 [Peltaster fructicola]
MATQSAPLAFSEFNTDALSSVVLIHGAFDNSTSWDCVRPHLNDYHLLVPDLPAHGRSRKAFPSFSTIQAADKIADVVRRHGKNGKARIVGLSLGSHVALQIITRHPEVVDDDALLTGYNIWSEVNSGVFASLGWLGARVGDLVPASKAAQETRRDADGCLHLPQPWSFWKELAGIICTEAWPQPWPARTLIIAAGDGGPAPVTDRPGSARKLRDIGLQGNAETVAVWNDKITHPWPIEKPELFAETTLAWFQREPLPEGFVKL